MRIALRPSGGRGDYELAGSYNNRSASDLLDKDFYFQIAPNLIIDGKSQAHKLSGKTRIRPEKGKHAYVVLSSVLLLPSPRRELVKTSDVLVELIAGEYTLAGIDVDIIEEDANKVLFAPTALWAKNRGGILKIDFAERMAIISTIWAASGIFNSDISNLLSQHEEAAKYSDHVSLQRISTQLYKYFNTKKDILPIILNMLGLPDPSSTVYSGISNIVSEFESEDNSKPPEISSRDRIRKWRMQTIRGPGAREFSVQVRNAYDYRCLFSGERFPKLEQTSSAGVDGAHILPWSTHELNSVVNGLCLCKQCHWAFDNGLLKLEFDESENVYLLSIPSVIRDSAIKENFDLDRFSENIGPIDKSRLPANKNYWPSPKHIREMNSSAQY